MMFEWDGCLILLESLFIQLGLQTSMDSWSIIASEEPTQ